MNPSVSSTAPVAVLGAGPYGLSTAAHLHARGVPVRVFGEVMGTWRNRMPTGMYLKSTPWASSIAAPRAGFTLADYSRAHGLEPLAGHAPVPIQHFIDYGTWFQQQLVPEVETAAVERIDRAGTGYEVELSAGERFAARAVVIASGFLEFAYVPTELASLAPDGPSPSALMSHTSQLHDLGVFAGRRVAVSGAGQSALETAALLHEQGADVEVLVRGPAIVFGTTPARLDKQAGTLRNPESTLGPGWMLLAIARYGALFRRLPERKRLQLVDEVLGPAGAWWLRERFVGHVPVDLATRVRRAEREGAHVRLELEGIAGSRELTVDHVVAATGYAFDIDRVGFLAPDLRRSLRRTGSWPWLSPSFESSLRGLYFVGIAAAAIYGPVMRFVCGTPFPARRVSAALAG